MYYGLVNMMRKCSKFLITTITIINILLFDSFRVFATDNGVQVSELSEEKIEDVIGRMNVSLLAEEPKRNYISCFNVSPSGLIVVGRGSIFKEICVYSSDGVFQYGILDKSSNGSYYVEFDDQDNVVVYYVRSDYKITYDRDGKIIDVQEVLKTVSNEQYFRSNLDARTREQNGTKYIIRNDMGLLNLFAMSKYSKLIKLTPENEEIVLYDISTKHTVVTGIGLALVVIICICIVVYLVKLCKCTRASYKARMAAQRKNMSTNGD